jgi:DNA-directed RNA polymerase subunit RPC12/RpoP
MDLIPKGMMEEMAKKAAEAAEAQWDKCSFCPKKLPPNMPCNRLYDQQLGSIIACADCSMKAIVWYAKKMKGSEP